MLDTLLTNAQKQGVMTTPEIGATTSTGSNTLIIAGVAILGLLIGAVAGHSFWPQQDRDDPPAKYVLNFGNPATEQRVAIKMPDFETALSSPAPRWHKNLSKHLRDGSDNPIDPPVGTAPPIKLRARLNVTQENDDGSKNTLHVTQKVGLDNLEQLKAVLAAIETENPK